MARTKLMLNVGARFRPDPAIQKAAHILDLLDEAREEVESLSEDVEITWGLTEQQKLEDTTRELEWCKRDFESQEKLLDMHRKGDKQTMGIMTFWFVVAVIEFVLLMR